MNPQSRATFNHLCVCASALRQKLRGQLFFAERKPLGSSSERVLVHFSQGALPGVDLCSRPFSSHTHIKGGLCIPEGGLLS